jgi:GTP cyclohydrolase I
MNDTGVITQLLKIIGEDPSRKGLRETPERVLRMWAELTAGYGQDPREILGRTFEDPGSDMVVLSGVRFSSVCEHHLLPFTGSVAVGYLPHGKIIGISKIARLVDCFSKRLQVQERMTKQIAEAIEEHLQPRGTGVIARAHHFCMGCRGAMQRESEMTTTAFLGDFRESGVRGEFFAAMRAGA